MPESVDPKFAPTASLFRQHCAACHGVTGEGNGPAYTTFETRPRNFRAEPFRYISTTSGGAPSDEDLVRTIKRGLGHSRMPAAPQLDDTQALRLAYYVREIRRLGIMEQLSTKALPEPTEQAAEEYGEYGEAGPEEELTPEQIEQIATEQVTPGPVTTVPPRSENYMSDTVQARALFAQNCAACHGPIGRGDGPQELRDVLGHRIRPRDLMQGAFRGGSGDSDLYWRIRCGLPGTPMPGFSQLTDEQVWQLVDYVRGLSEGKR